MLKIRYLRRGKKNRPFFFIVVVNQKRSPQSGKFIEKIGFYDPITKDMNIKKERIEYWLSKGAKPSDTVYNLLVENKILSGKKIPVHKISKKKKEEEEKEEKVIEKKEEQDQEKEQREEQNEGGESGEKES